MHVYTYLHVLHNQNMNNEQLCTIQNSELKAQSSKLKDRATVQYKNYSHRYGDFDGKKGMSVMVETTISYLFALYIIHYTQHSTTLYTPYTKYTEKYTH